MRSRTSQSLAWSKCTLRVVRSLHPDHLSKRRFADFVHSFPNRFLKTSLGAPTKAEHDALVAEKEGLQTQLDDAKATIEKLQAEVRRTDRMLPPSSPKTLVARG